MFAQATRGVRYLDRELALAPACHTRAEGFGPGLKPRPLVRFDAGSSRLAAAHRAGRTEANSGVNTSATACMLDMHTAAMMEGGDWPTLFVGTAIRGRSSTSKGVIDEQAFRFPLCRAFPPQQGLHQAPCRPHRRHLV